MHTSSTPKSTWEYIMKIMTSIERAYMTRKEKKSVYIYILLNRIIKEIYTAVKNVKRRKPN